MDAVCDSTIFSVALRPVEARDAEFLFSVFASTRAEELAAVNWDEGQKESFLRMQFDAQKRFYESNYPGAQFEVIMVDDQPAGRLYQHSQPQEIRIMEIALLPEFRRRGVGTALLKDILAHAQSTSRRATIHVEMFNPAQRLYERLGFRQIASHGIHHLLEWTGHTSSQKDSP